MLVITHNEVCVVAKNRTRENSVRMLFDRATKTVCNRISDQRVKPKRWVFELGFGIAKEFFELIARRLDASASEVYLA